MIIVAKETDAAVNHSDEYPGYTTLLGTNAGDLASVVGSAYGNTAGAQLAQTWNEEDAGLIDYAIGIVVHDQARANTAWSSVMTQSVPQLAQLLAELTKIPASRLIEAIHNELTAVKEMVDDTFGQRYKLVYTELHNASLAGAGIGDLLIAPIAQRFADKFPGDPTARPVDSRVQLALSMQEGAYLSTLMTETVVAGRAAENLAVSSALVTNANALSALVAGRFGSQTGAAFLVAWSGRLGGLAGYAGGDQASARQLIDYDVTQLSTQLRIDPGPLKDQAAAAIKVIDDQRSRSYDVLADDDRAAAAATQAVSDELTA